MSEASLQALITEDMKSAMKAKEADRLGTIRLLRAAIKQREIDERITLDDTQVLAVIDKMIKQRRDSIEQYTNADRPELAAIEQAEIEVLKKYMPEPLSENEVNAFIKDAITSTNASSMRDMGKVMAMLKPKLQGRADIGAVSAQVKALLNE